MKFPLLKGKSKYPTKNNCAWCKRSKVCEPHSFAVLDGGALLINRRTGDGGPDDRLDGFFDLTWHGAHKDEGGKGEYSDIIARVGIAKDVRGGQFEIYFCSTKCLREFLNHAVDKLEEKRSKGVKNR
jgi:hypothetical protein